MFEGLVKEFIVITCEFYELIYNVWGIINVLLWFGAPIMQRLSYRRSAWHWHISSHYSIIALDGLLLKFPTLISVKLGDFVCLQCLGNEVYYFVEVGKGILFYFIFIGFPCVGHIGFLEFASFGRHSGLWPSEIGWRVCGLFGYLKVICQCMHWILVFGVLIYERVEVVDGSIVCDNGATC